MTDVLNSRSWCLIGMHGAFRGSMQHEPDEEVSWCDDVARG